jgi:hypothetical protein
MRDLGNIGDDLKVWGKKNRWVWVGKGGEG